MKLKLLIYCTYALSWIPINTFKVMIYRLFGMQIQRNTIFGFGSIISSKNIIIGTNVTIGNNVIIACDKGIEIGDEVIIKDNTLISGHGKITIGKNCYLGRGMVIDCTEDVIFGDKVLISYSKIFTHDFSLTTFVKGMKVRTGPVKIGSNTWIGPDSFFVPNITISENSYIGPKSLITEDTEPYIYYMGNPARGVQNIKKRISEATENLNFSENLEKLILGMNFRLNDNIDHQEVVSKEFINGRYTIIIMHEIDIENIHHLINSIKIGRKIIILSLAKFENKLLQQIKIIRNKKLTFIDLNSCKYFPNNFSRRSLIWNLKSQLHNIGVYLSPL